MYLGEVGEFGDSCRPVARMLGLVGLYGDVGLKPGDVGLLYAGEVGLYPGEVGL